jgi:peptide/nickel transport system substrate-binding protein
LLKKGERSRKTLKKSKIGFIALALGILLLSMPMVSASITYPVDQPRVDEIWYKVIQEDSTAVADMKDGKLDYMPGAPTYKDYIDFQTLGFNTTLAEMAAFAWFGFNCRDYTPDYAPNPGVSLEPCNDSIFRTAMHYAIGHEEKERITSLLLGPLNYPLDSIVPDAQAFFHNDAVYIGKNWDLAKQMLLDAGYTVVGGKLYNPDGTEVRTIELLYSSGSTLLKQTIEAYCVVWNQFFEWMGVTAAGGGGYLQYPIKPTPMAFGSIVMKILFYHNFDMITLGWTGLGRFPDYLYDFFNTRWAVQGAYNFGGFSNETADELTETIKFSLDVNEIRDAAFEFQEHFSYEWNPYIVRTAGYQAGIYGRRNPSTGEIRRLTNFVPLPSYGADNDWTWDLMHWEDNPSGTCDYINRRIAMPPTELHPWYSDELYEWNIMDRTIAGLLTVQPGTLADMPNIACNWTVTYWKWPALGIEKGMKVRFNLRHDVYWQNGDQVTADDVMMNWDMLREWKPGRYSSMWENLIYTEVEDPFTVAAYINQTSITTLYDFAGTALFFPKRILLELEARLHDTSDPWYHNPSAFTPATIDYSAAFFTHTTVPVDPHKVDPLISPKYEGDPIPAYVAPPPKPAKMVENYKLLIGCNAYIYDYWHAAENMAHSVKYPGFWWDCSVEQNFIAPTRVDPGAPFTFYLEVQNLGAKTAGEFSPVTLAYINLTKDDVVYAQVPGPIEIPSFETIVIGSDGYVTYTQFQAGIRPTPFTQVFPVKGPHWLDCLCVEVGPTPLTESYYKHFMWITIKEDINLDFKVDLKDVYAAGKAYGSKPGSAKFDPRCDVNDDFKIDLKDYYAICKKYGKI